MKRVFNTDFDYNKEFTTPSKNNPFKEDLLKSTINFSKEKEQIMQESEFDKHTITEQIIESANHTAEEVRNHPPASNKNNFKAIISMLISNFIYAIIGLLHKLIFIKEPSIGPFSQITLKYFAMAILSKLYIIFYTNPEEINESYEFFANNRKIVYLRLITGWITALFYILAVQYLNISAVGIAMIMIPLCTTLFYSAIISKEEIENKDVIIFIVCIISSMFLLGTDDTSVNEEYGSYKGNALYGSLALLCFIIFMCARSLTQKLVNKLHIMHNVYLVGIFCGISNLICCIIFNEEIMSLSLVMLMFFLGFLDFGSLLFNIYSINVGDMGLIQQYMYSYLPFSCILSFLFAGETIGLVKIICISLIFALNFYRSYHAYLDSSNKEKEKEINMRSSLTSN